MSLLKAAIAIREKDAKSVYERLGAVNEHGDVIRKLDEKVADPEVALTSKELLDLVCFQLSQRFAFVASIV